MSQSKTPERIGLGILLGVLAYSCFTIHDAGNKWLVGHFSTAQVITFRSGEIVLLALIAGRRTVIERAIATPLKFRLLSRGALALCAWLLYYSAARRMPFPQLMTLYFSAPIITTLLAIPLLGEKVSATRWIALGIGFSGVLVASDPFGLRISADTFMVLAAACLWGYAIILMRQIARAESSMVQMLYQNGFFAMVMLPFCILNFVMPQGIEWAILLGVGLLGGAGQYLLFEAARHAPASVMGTVEYTALVWAFVLGYLVFGDESSLPVSLGAALICCAGVFLFVSERRR